MPGADLGKIEGRDSVIEMFVYGGIPKVAGGASVVALSEVMDGHKERMFFSKRLYIYEQLYGERRICITCRRNKLKNCLVEWRKIHYGAYLPCV